MTATDYAVGLVHVAARAASDKIAQHIVAFDANDSALDDLARIKSDRDFVVNIVVIFVCREVRTDSSELGIEFIVIDFELVHHQAINHMTDFSNNRSVTTGRPSNKKTCVASRLTHVWKFDTVRR